MKFPASGSGIFRPYHSGVARQRNHRFRAATEKVLLEAPTLFVKESGMLYVADMSRTRTKLASWWLTKLPGLLKMRLLERYSAHQTFGSGLIPLFGSPLIAYVL